MLEAELIVLCMRVTVNIVLMDATPRPSEETCKKQRALNLATHLNTALHDRIFDVNVVINLK